MSEENLIKAMEYGVHIKKALSLAVNIHCGFEGNVEDATKLLSLIVFHESRIAELDAENGRLKSCESALISIVNQFFHSKDGDNILFHTFMSAEEEAADYLVEHGIARWADERKSSICFNEVEE